MKVIVISLDAIDGRRVWHVPLSTVCAPGFRSRELVEPKDSSGPPAHIVLLGRGEDDGCVGNTLRRRRSPLPTMFFSNTVR